MAPSGQGRARHAAEGTTPAQCCSGCESPAVWGALGLGEGPGSQAVSYSPPLGWQPLFPCYPAEPRGDHSGVDSHPAWGEQWGPPPWAHLVPSIFMLVPGQRLVALSSLAMCTQPHLLLKKSRCTCQGPSSFERVLSGLVGSRLLVGTGPWAPAVTRLSDTLSPTLSLSSVPLVAPTGRPHTQRQPRMWALSRLGIQPVSTPRMPRSLWEAKVAPRGSQAACGGWGLPLERLLVSEDATGVGKVQNVGPGTERTGQRRLRMGGRRNIAFNWQNLHPQNREQRASPGSQDTLHSCHTHVSKAEDVSCLSTASLSGEGTS